MFFRLLLAVLLLAASQIARAEPVFPPGSRVGLDVPGDLKLSSRLSGFEDIGRKVLVEVRDLPRASYDQLLSSAFANEQSARNVKRESFPYRNGVGYLISGDVTQDGIALHLFFLIGSPVAAAPADDLVGLVRVAVPEAARGVYSDDVIRTMLASMTFRQAPVAEQLSMLPYEVKELAGFRVFRVAPPMVMLVDGEGSDLARQAHVVVSVGQGAAASPDDRARAARSLIASAPFRDITLQLAEPMRLSNAPAYEIRAQAQAPDGSPVSMVQWVRFGTAGYVQIVGVSPRDKWDELFPRFRAIRDGIGPR